MDGGDVLTGVSDSWLALLGYSRADVIGRRVSDFWAPGDRSSIEIERSALWAEGEVRDLERRFVTRDGAVIEAVVSSRLERRGGKSWVLSALTDVTARRRAEAALRASEERLHQAQKMEAVGQLTGGIAHDFNNMLQGIGGSLELMERRIAQGRTEELGRYITAARQAVDRAAGLTYRMLAFARRQSLQPRNVEPDSLIKGMEELIRRTVGPEIELDLRLRDGAWPALCDPNQLESALLNLAINARDAMPEGGSLTIATADRHLTEADLAHQDGITAGDFVEITVADTGEGMPPDVLERAFEPFFTTKPLGQGTGLGLSQIYGFVQQSGGFVRLESEPGAGTTVRVYLPRHVRSESTDMDAAGSRSASPGIGPRASAGGTVLVVEDEEGVRDLIVDSLRDLGCEVLQAVDGPSGLRIVMSGEQLDLLITDVGLPGLNGRQLADAAREVRPGLAVLLITGYAGKTLIDAELPPGMEVIHKPFQFDALARRVRDLLETSMTR
jgi:PAS domain S-box-containing protein